VPLRDVQDYARHYSPPTAMTTPGTRWTGPPPTPSSSTSA